MSTRPFRFGVVATPQEGRDRWLALARRAEELGYATLLMPDGVQLLSPWPSLLAAAAATNSLHVGTFVVASPLRHPRLAAWDAHSLSVMSAGRFALGIGTRRDLMKAAAQILDIPEQTPAQRLKQVEATIDQLRTLDGEQHTPVMIAAGDRFDQLELSANIFVVGEQVLPWVSRFIQMDVSALVEADSLTMLRGSVDDMCAELERRRETLGISYVTVNAAFYEELGPVVACLSSR